MSFQLLDYRNAKYQGSITSQRQRNGPGILIDDDLTFYLSQWKQNQLHGSTLVYISHGKYLYGQWNMNQPHGLNVMRSGDTVLLGQFVQGVLKGNSLLIFEKYNFGFILAYANNQCKIVRSGKLTNHQSLINFIHDAGLNVPEHYFSLTKFSCSFSKHSNQIKALPYNSNCCYFGFAQGLAIVFNPNNALVSIGFHSNAELCQFGAKFLNSRTVEQGNFQTNGQRIKYNGQRPSSQIVSIYQKLHKRSINFINQYFDPKIKSFRNVQGMLKSMINQLSNQCQRSFNKHRVDLNDSLQYQEYNQQQSLKINEARNVMYSPPKKYIEKSSYSPIKQKKHEQKYDHKKAKDDQEQQIVTKSPAKSQIRSKNVSKSKPEFQKIVDSQMKHQQKSQKKRNSSNFTQENKKICQKDSQGLSNVYFAKKSPIKTREKEEIQVRSSIQQKSASRLTPSKNRLYLNEKSGQEESESKDGSLRTLSRRNSVYFNNKSQITLEKQLKISRNNNIQQIQSKNSRRQQVFFPQNKKVPTFRALLDQKQTTKGKNEHKLTIFDQINIELPSKSKVSSKNKVQQAVDIPELSKQKDEIKSRISSRNLTKYDKPTYEDIEERRKRIMKELQQEIDINQPTQPENRPLRSSYTNLAQETFSPKARTFQQDSFGFMPLSISQKQNKLSDNTQKSNDLKQISRAFTRTSRENQTPSKISQTKYQKQSKEVNNEELVDSGVKAILSRINSISKVSKIPTARQQQNSPTFCPANKVSPIRQKRSFQYVVE